MITSTMIACGKRYLKVAVISINSFLKYNSNFFLYVITDEAGKQHLLSLYKSDNLKIINVEEPLKRVLRNVFLKKFEKFNVDDDGEHDRIYSALKPLIMDAAIEDDCQYILSLDADTIFTGNILKIVKSYLEFYNHKYDLYMVARKDARMQLSGNGIPGSGFTLWKRNGKFIDLFRNNLDEQCTWAKKGGSQRIICNVSQMPEISFMELEDPFLHFVSPDVANSKLTDEDISQFKPAYIHLHGIDSYLRLLNFERIFCGL